MIAGKAGSAFRFPLIVLVLVLVLDLGRWGHRSPLSRLRIENEDDCGGAKGFSFATTTTHTITLPYSVTPELLQLLNSFPNTPR